MDLLGEQAPATSCGRMKLSAFALRNPRPLSAQDAGNRKSGTEDGWKSPAFVQERHPDLTPVPEFLHHAGKKGPRLPVGWLLPRIDHAAHLLSCAGRI